jgi:hypothetical protein
VDVCRMYVFPAPQTVKPSLNIYQAAHTQELGRHVRINGLNARTDFLKKFYFGALVSMFAIVFTQLSILVFYSRVFSASQTMQLCSRVAAGVVVCGRTGFVSSDLSGVVPHPS